MNKNVILSLVVGIILFTVLLSVARTVIPTGATAYHNLSDDMGSKTEIYGTSASAFAATTDDLLGWFWVVSPFILAIGLVMSLFVKRGR